MQQLRHGHERKLAGAYGRSRHRSPSDRARSIAAHTMTASVFVLTYGAVFAAELVGDKLLYTASALTARYRAIPIVSGAMLAFIVKTGTAVLVGEAVSRIPRIFLAGITTVSFVWVAYVLLKKPSRNEAARARQDPSNGMLMSFAIVLFSEWGDLGQVTTATMAARFGTP